MDQDFCVSKQGVDAGFAFLLLKAPQLAVRSEERGYSYTIDPQPPGHNIHEAAVSTLFKKKTSLQAGCSTKTYLVMLLFEETGERQTQLQSEPYNLSKYCVVFTTQFLKCNKQLNPNNTSQPQT